MAKEHLRKQDLTKLEGTAATQYDIALELQKEINGLDRFDEDIPRANNVVDVSEPTDEQIKDIEGKVDRNQFGTIELPTKSPRNLLDINLTTEIVQIASIGRVVDLEFKHFGLKVK